MRLSTGLARVLTLALFASSPACGEGAAARGTNGSVVSAPAVAATSAWTPPPDLTSTPDAAAATSAAPAEPPASTATAVVPPPRPATIHLSTGNGDPSDAEVIAGDDAFERGDLDAAERHFSAAHALAARSPGPVVGLARVHIARVDVPLDFAAAKGNTAILAASVELARVARLVPPFGPALIELGRARLLLGDAPGSLDALKRGVQVLPDEPEAHSQLGVAWLATGRVNDAVRELSRAAELDPGSPAREGNLGTALMMAGRTREAIAQYETRARSDDGDARAHSDLGTALLGTEDLERALSELQRAVQLDPTRAAYHSNLGFALQQTGRMDRAIAEYHEALRLDPGFASAWINLATALARNPATRPDARAALARARALSPDDPRVRANIDELDALEGKKPPGGAHP
jgi:Flp pilus assembly protein TadD